MLSITIMIFFGLAMVHAGKFVTVSNLANMPRMKSSIRELSPFTDCLKRWIIDPNLLLSLAVARL